MSFISDNLKIRKLNNEKYFLEKDIESLSTRSNWNGEPIYPHMTHEITAQTFGYEATETIYPELLWDCIYITRRYVKYMIPRSETVSPRVRRASRSCVDLVIVLKNGSTKLDKSILPKLIEEVKNETYDFTGFSVELRYRANYLEKTRKNYKKLPSKTRNSHIIAELDVLLKQELVISKKREHDECPSYLDWRRHSFEEYMEKSKEFEDDEDMLPFI